MITIQLIFCHFMTSLIQRFYHLRRRSSGKFSSAGGNQTSKRKRKCSAKNTHFTLNHVIVDQLWRNLNSFTCIFRRESIYDHDICLQVRWRAEKRPRSFSPIIVMCEPSRNGSPYTKINNTSRFADPKNICFHTNNFLLHHLRGKQQPATFLDPPPVFARCFAPVCANLSRTVFLWLHSPHPDLSFGGRIISLGQ